MRLDKLKFIIRKSILKFTIVANDLKLKRCTYIKTYSLFFI